MQLSERPYLKNLQFRPDSGLDKNSYPFTIPAVRDIEAIEFHADVTFFVGENGSGKSTVLEAMAVAMGFGPEGGTKNVQLQTVDSISPLHQALRLVKSFKKPKDGYFLRAESFFNIATYMDKVGYLDGYGGKSLHHRSHGEAFMSLLTDKFRGKGLYFLDEPEAALSPNRQLAALAAIHELVLEESQFIIATHSPILLAYPNSTIYHFHDEGISRVQYKDTEHYQITKDFLNCYPRRLEQILSRE